VRWKTVAIFNRLRARHDGKKRDEMFVGILPLSSYLAALNPN